MSDVKKIQEWIEKVVEHTEKEFGKKELKEKEKLQFDVSRILKEVEIDIDLMESFVALGLRTKSLKKAHAKFMDNGKLFLEEVEEGLKEESALKLANDSLTFLSAKKEVDEIAKFIKEKLEA